MLYVVAWWLYDGSDRVQDDIVRNVCVGCSARATDVPGGWVAVLEPLGVRLPLVRAPGVLATVAAQVRAPPRPTPI